MRPSPTRLVGAGAECRGQHIGLAAIADPAAPRACLRPGPVDLRDLPYATTGSDDCQTRSRATRARVPRPPTCIPFDGTLLTFERLARRTGAGAGGVAERSSSSQNPTSASSASASSISASTDCVDSTRIIPGPRRHQKRLRARRGHAVADAEAAACRRRRRPSWRRSSSGGSGSSGPSGPRWRRPPPAAAPAATSVSTPEPSLLEHLDAPAVNGGERTVRRAGSGRRRQWAHRQGAPRRVDAGGREALSGR